MNNKNLNIIPVFIAIYEELSLSKAAHRLGITQPAVSKQLAHLREVYGETLFNRGSPNLTPTNFAIDIYPSMVTALKNFNATLASSSQFSPKYSERIFSIACLSAASQFLIPELFDRIKKIAPGITLEIHPLFVDDYDRSLRTQDYDIILDLPIKKRHLLKSTLVFSGRLAIACKKDHPRIKDICTKKQYLKEKHVVMSKYSTRSNLLNDEDIHELMERNIIYRAPGALETLPIIQNTEALGLLPLILIKKFSEIYNIKAIEIPFDYKTFNVHAYWHPSRNSEPAFSWLITQLKKAGRSATKKCIEEC